MLFIYYPKCSTCQKALKYLKDNNVDIELRDIKLNNPTKEEILSWSKKGNIEIQKFFNTSGLIYREKNLSTLTKTMSDEEKLELLQSDGMLVKRPILITNDKVLLGFKENEYKRIL